MSKPQPKYSFEDIINPDVCWHCGSAEVDQIGHAESEDRRVGYREDGAVYECMCCGETWVER